ncbi:MAG: YfhO family protein [Candidatus Firestonebacteria bacterium]|nr:YfhO family protein [Candidatus Firestonebacteria bacterium]
MINKDSKKYYTLFVCLFFILLSLILYSNILFTNEMINARDIIADHFYGRSGFHKEFKYFNHPLWSNVKQLGLDESPNFLSPHIPDMFFFLKALPVPVSFAWQMVTFITLGGIFMYLFCRKLGLSYFSSMAAGLFFSMSSELVTYMNAGHYSKVIMISYIPLILFFLEKGFQDRKIFNFLITGFIIGYVFFYRQDQIIFYICLLVAYYTIFRLYYIYTEDTEKDINLVNKLFWYSFIMTIFLFAIISITLLPALSWGGQTDRAGGVSYEFGVTWSMPPEELLAYFFPKIFGLSSPNMMDPNKIKVFYWGRMPFTQTSSYLGIFPLFFALLAFLNNRKKYVKIFGILILVVFPLAMGGFTPIYNLVFKLPGFKMFRVPRAILCIIPVAVSVMAGFGCEWFFEKMSEDKKVKIKKILYKLVIGWVVVVIFTISGWIFKENMLEIFANNIRGDNWALFRYSNYLMKYNYFYESLVSFIIISGIIIIWSLLRNYPEIPENILKAICVIVFVIDVGMINEKFISTIPVEQLDAFNNIPKGMQFIKDKEKDNSIFSYRVFPNVSRALEYNRSNSWTAHFQIIEGYTGVRNKLYTEFMQNVSLDNRLLDIMNIKYIALDRQIIPYKDLIPKMKLGDYIIGYVDNDVIILENPRARERIHVVYKYMVAAGPGAVFTRLKNISYNPLTTIVLEENPEEAKLTSETPLEKEKIEIKKIFPGSYDINIEMPESGFLVFSDTYYPGWKAYIDGKEARIYKTDYLVSSVFVQKGKHQVEMLFKPAPFIIGAWISGISFASLIIIAGLKFAGKFEL